jgi:hypothetical protein
LVSGRIASIQDYAKRANALSAAAVEGTGLDLASGEATSCGDTPFGVRVS